MVREEFFDTLNIKVRFIFTNNFLFYPYDFYLYYQGDLTSKMQDQLVRSECIRIYII